MIDTTLKRRENLYAKLFDKNIDVLTAKKYTIKEWNTNLGTNIRKKASLEGQKRLLDQITANRKDIFDYNIKKIKMRNTDIIKAMEKKSIELTMKVPMVKVAKTKTPVGFKPKVQYIVSKIITDKNQLYFIKWNNPSDFNRQLRILRASKSFENYHIYEENAYNYPPFVVKETKAEIKALLKPK